MSIKKKLRKKHAFVVAEQILNCLAKEYSKNFLF
jgi:hypothetical protein